MSAIDPSSPGEIKGHIVSAAAALGFGDCRIASIHRAAHAEHFEQWIKDGTHGDMAWLARATERRTDPNMVLPGARAMIVVAMNYFVDPPGESSGSPSTPEPGARGTSAATGVFARYAWGDDYHDIMEARLHTLAEKLADHGGTQKVYVDTGPVLERDFATDAGLGWNGKSTVQIHRQLGAWFFLGEILTTLPLPPDPPLTNHCGSCTRCLQACPTQAITSPHHLDARRCLSYLTIEHKGSIPVEFREAMGRRIYGCDDCLSVCPWNRFARASREAAFAARPHVADWSLRQFLGLDDEGFRRLFKNSPIKRLKRPGFLRNVCVALGNSGSEEDLPALRQAADDPHPLISEHAQWAIGRIAQRIRQTAAAPPLNLKTGMETTNRTSFTNTQEVVP